MRREAGQEDVDLRDEGAGRQKKTLSYRERAIERANKSSRAFRR